MKVIVTGATGSIGSSIVDRLVKKGHEVIGLGQNKEKIEIKLASHKNMIDKIDR